jgi:hypothetical protein
VKDFAKQALLFCISFLIILLAAASLKFLSLRVDWAKNLPPKPETSLTLLIAASHWALSVALFSSVLFSLCYSARRNYSALMTIISIMSLSFLFCIGFSFILDNWESVPSAQNIGIPLGDKGLILSNSLTRNETVVILLNGEPEPIGQRVSAIPGQPLVYHESSGANITLPPIPFNDNTPWFLKSLSIDIRLNAEMFQKKFIEGFFPYFIYAGSLIFLLCSLGHTIKFSAWPLANLFLGALAFRGILALETFLNNPEMQEIIDSYLNGMIPLVLAVPFIFLGAGILLHLYSFLVFVINKRGDDEY